MEIWYQSLAWALRQAEETFCDFLGLRIFGWSYLEAFAYLLSPGVPGPRSTVYPAMLNRIDNLLGAAQTYGVVPSASYKDQFDDSGLLPLSVEDQFRLEIADQALSQLVNGLVQEANQVVTTSGITTSTDAERDAIYGRFKLVVPREKCNCVADILNAAWRAFSDDQFWRDNAQIAAKKDAVLKELVLKNIELFEIEQILKEAP